MQRQRSRVLPPIAAARGSSGSAIGRLHRPETAFPQCPHEMLPSVSIFSTTRRGADTFVQLDAPLAPA